MGKIILIYPKTGLDKKYVTVGLPLSILYPATILKKEGYSVKILDQRIDKEFRINLEKELDASVICIGISCMMGKQIDFMLEIIDIIKNIRDLPIIIGGQLPTLFPEIVIENEKIDILIIGDNDDTFLHLIRGIEKGDISKVKDIAYRENGRRIFNEKGRLFDPNENYMPDYSLIDVNNYITTQTHGEKDIMMYTARGCPYRCNFCYITAFKDKHLFRPISPENIVNHISYIVNNLGISAIHITDDNFFTTKNRIEEVCDLINNKGIKVKMRATCRADAINRYDEDFLRKAKESGFVEFFIGAESGSDRILRLIKKDITVKQILEANKILKKVGIKPKFSFMVGISGETKKEVEETLKLMKRIVEENPDAYLTPLQTLAPYPKTELFEIGGNSLSQIKDLKDLSELNFNTTQKLYWLKKEDENFVKNASYFSYLLDGKSVAEYSGNSSIIKILNKAYSSILKFRIDMNFYLFMPEVFLISYYFNKKM